jgi:hypothetical protein
MNQQLLTYTAPVFLPHPDGRCWKTKSLDESFESFERERGVGLLPAGEDGGLGPSSAEQCWLSHYKWMIESVHWVSVT